KMHEGCSMIFLSIFFCSLLSSASFLEDTGREIASPVTTKAKYYLLGGSLLTVLLTLDAVEDSLGHDVQNDTVEDKPLGDLSTIGDWAGQLVPNVIYVGTMYGFYYFTENLNYRSKSIHMLKSTTYTVLTTTLLKALIREPRPAEGNKNVDSFPSGHTASAFAFAAVIGTEHEWYWGTAAYALATFVGFSRINDNAHRLHDVVGGAVIGLTYGLSLHYLYNDESSEIAKVYLSPLKDGLILGYRTEF
ncbi:phosphatase PAP2 family protein, partial [bacterium]|nr:phosphatase PAP2 family protein [bacterium]